MTPFEAFFWLIIFPVVEYLGWDEFKRNRAKNKLMNINHEEMEKL